MDTFFKILEGFNNLLTPIGVVGGGVILVLYLRRKQRKDEWNLQMTIEPSVIVRKNEKPVLIVTVSLKNIGQIELRPGVRGCELSIKKVVNQLPAGSFIDWDNQKEFILKENNILEKYKQCDNHVYVIEPNCTYNEKIGVIAEEESLYMIEATFFYEKKNESITEYSYIYTGYQTGGDLQLYQKK